MEVGKVVETSFHHINGKYGRTGSGGRLLAQSSPVSRFSYKTDIDLSSHLIEEYMHRMIEEDADAKL
jgi:hypothetical protein